MQGFCLFVVSAEGRLTALRKYINPCIGVLFAFFSILHSLAFHHLDFRVGLDVQLTSQNSENDAKTSPGITEWSLASAK